MESGQKPPQVSLLLRLLGGGYLVYLAYGLFKDGQGKAQFLAAAVLFALVGGALFLHSLITLVKSGYFSNSPPPGEEQEPEEAPEEE